MLSYLFILSTSDTVENRIFIQNNPSFTGAWEYSGDARFIDDIFYLIPGKPRSIGGIYYTEKLGESFAAQINISFESVSNDNPCNLGIWITKDYHQNPVVFGGPLSFNGVALMMVYNGSVLNTEFRKNDKHGRFISYQYFPTSFEEIFDNKLQFRIENRGGTNVTVWLKTGSKNKILFNEIPLSSLRKYYLSVTTKNGKKPNKIMVSSAFVSNDPDDDLSPIILKIEGKNKTTITKNTETKTAKQQFVSQFSTVNEVLDQILEFDLFSQELTKMSDVRALISKEMLPLSDRWQRRSIRIMRYTQALRQNLTNILNNSHIQIEQVKQDLEENIVDLMKSYKEVESELFYGITNAYDMHNEIKKEKKEGLHNLSEVLMYVGVFELALAVLVILGKMIIEKLTHFQ